MQQLSERNLKRLKTLNDNQGTMKVSDLSDAVPSAASDVKAGFVVGLKVLVDQGYVETDISWNNLSFNFLGYPETVTHPSKQKFNRFFRRASVVLTPAGQERLTNQEGKEGTV